MGAGIHSRTQAMTELSDEDPDAQLAEVLRQMALFAQQAPPSAGAAPAGGQAIGSQTGAGPMGGIPQ